MPSPLSGCQSVIDVLRHITQGGPEWAYRYVILRFPGAENGWVVVYPLQDTREPYFDFMYTGKESPTATLPTLLGKYPQCEVIDWSPGRLACISASDTDIETLAEIIRDLAQEAWSEQNTFVQASYEQMTRA
nr:hypothetical protein [uncultured Pseudomonas sp.]